MPDTQQVRTYLQWGAGNVYLLVLSSWKVNIAEKTIAIMGFLVDTFGPEQFQAAIH